MYWSILDRGWKLEKNAARKISQSDALDAHSGAAQVRTVKEWIGKTDDSAIPPRVALRVYIKFNGQCQCGCGRKILAGERWDCDHIIALCNAGQNRESNLQPLLTAHHRAKTKQDVAIKSKNYERSAKHLGIKRKSGFQTNRNGRFRKKMDGTMEFR